MPWRRWWPALGWGALIFVLSSVPGAAYPTVRWRHADKVVHLGLYALMGALCARALALAPSATGHARASPRTAGGGREGTEDDTGKARGPSGRGQTTLARIVAAAAVATAYGVTDELHQLFVAGRSADWRDALADAVGGLIGAAAVILAGALAGRTKNA